MTPKNTYAKLGLCVANVREREGEIKRRYSLKDFPHSVNINLLLSIRGGGMIFHRGWILFTAQSLVSNPVGEGPNTVEGLHGD